MSSIILCIMHRDIGGTRTGGTQVQVRVPLRTKVLHIAGY